MLKDVFQNVADVLPECGSCSPRIWFMFSQNVAYVFPDYGLCSTSCSPTFLTIKQVPTQNTDMFLIRTSHITNTLLTGHLALKSGRIKCWFGGSFMSAAGLYCWRNISIRQST